MDNFQDDCSISVNLLKDQLMEETEDLNSMFAQKSCANGHKVHQLGPTNLYQLRAKRKYNRIPKLNQMRSKVIKKKSKNVFTCKTCSKSFNERGNLQVHIRIHTGERPYDCQFCDKKFTTIGNRNDHERRHAKFKPYSC